MDLSHRKALAVFEKNPNSFVIGSDTVVVVDKTILGKPQSREEAFGMLKRLSGRTHSVYTGVSIIAPTEVRNFFEKTDVVFWELTDEEITRM